MASRSSILGSGADRLYPKSALVDVNPGGHRAYLATEGKGDIAIAIDAINAAINVMLLSASKALQSDME